MKTNVIAVATHAYSFHAAYRPIGRIHH